MTPGSGNDGVTVTIDGVDVSVPAGMNVVDAAHALGVEVPIFCHHPRLEPVGMCRMCLVEVGLPDVDRATGEVRRDEDGRPIIRFLPKLQTGCTTKVSPGMVVRTATPEVGDARRSVLEFLLTSHPLDCPVCDKGGECPLQNLTMRYGPGTSRFEWGEKYRFPKPVPIGPLIALDRERCVLCARCIRFQDEVADDHVLGFENRGRGMEIVSSSDPAFDSVFSGNTTDICPVGALTTLDFRFRSRVWEVVPVPGICGHCPVGCNLTRDTRNGVTVRVMPERNEAVNEIWLCDKGRFAHHLPPADRRLTTPLVRRDGELVPATWDEALGHVAERLRGIIAADGREAVGGIAGDGLCNEDLYLFGRFLRGVIGTNNVDHRPGIVRDDIIARAGAGAGTRPTAIGRGSTVLVVGLDVEEEAPLLFLNLFKALGNGARIVVAGGQPQKLDRHAEVALRYRHETADRVIAVLVAQVLDRLDAVPISLPLAEARADLRKALAGFDAAVLEGEHPVRAEDIAAAADAIAGAEHLLVVYGREAAALGIVPALAALSAATGRAGGDFDGLVAVGPHANSQGAADMGLLPDLLPDYRPVSERQAHAELAAAGWPARRTSGAASGRSAVPAPGPVSVDGADAASGAVYGSGASEGAADSGSASALGLDPAPGLGAPAMLEPDSGIKALIVLGSDPVGDDPAYAASAKALELLVVTEIAPTATTRMAHVVLPAAALAERDGTLTNMFRRVQRTRAASPAPGSARPDWWIVAEIARRMGVVEAYGGPEDILAEIRAAVPAYRDLDPAALGRPAAGEARPFDPFLPFAPATEARHVSYEGTRYEVADSDGVAWSNATAPAEERLAPLLEWRPAALGSGEPGSADGGAEAGAPATAATVPGRMTLVPVTRLYDGGADMAFSPVLRPLVPDPHIEMGPFDAAARGLSDGARVTVSGVRGSARAEVRLRDGITPGTVLAPRSLARSIQPDALADSGATADVVVELEEASDGASGVARGGDAGEEG